MSTVKMIFEESNNPTNDELFAWIKKYSFDKVVEFVVRRDNNKILFEFDECPRNYVLALSGYFYSYPNCKVYAFALDNDDDDAMAHIYIRENILKNAGLLMPKSFWGKETSNEDNISLWKLLGFSEAFYNLFSIGGFDNMPVILDQRASDDYE
jgi:hypothetical protein